MGVGTVQPRRRAGRRAHRLGARGRECGQATVELAAVLPVMLAVAFIVVNATLFLSECAAFDRLFPQAVRVHAASPGYGQDPAACRGRVQAQLEEAFPQENLSVSVAVEEASGGLVRYRARLEFQPTLFGLGLRSEVFGVELPGLAHTAECTVDRYKPGVIV